MKRSLNDDFIQNQNLLNENQLKNHDLQKPEILQFMPEVSLPNFKRGECFACQQKSKSSSSTSSSSEMKYNQNFIPQFYCQPTLTPVSIDIPNVQYFSNSNLPNSFQSKIYTNGPQQEERYVYDRLGHKYKENQGSLKLVHPILQDITNSPIVGDSKSSNYDSNMENLLQQIISHHQDFIEASDHGEGILTPSSESQRQDLDIFLKRLIKDKFIRWLEHRHEHFSSDNNYENDSYERVQRSIEEEDYEIIPLTKDGIYLLKLIPKQKFNNKNKLNDLQQIKNNYIVKFRKNDKILQLLTSPQNKYKEKETSSNKQNSTSV